MKIIYISFFKRKDLYSLEEEVKQIKPYYIILEKLAEKHTVLSIANNDKAEDYVFKGVLYKRIIDKTSLKLPLIKTFRVIIKEQPDILIIHSLHFPLQIIYAHFFLKKSIKILVQHHAENPFNGLKRKLLNLANKYIDGYLFVSKEMAKEWVLEQNLIDIKKVFEIMEISSVFSCINKQEAVEITKVNGANIFLWVGRLNANKDPLTVVKAFIDFLQAEIDAKLYMIFQTEDLLVDIKKVIAENEIVKNKIVLLGKKNHTELLYWYNSADFIIASSYYEGSGTAVCEAMSCGCIPLLSNIPSFKKMTENASCGLLFEVGNIKSLVKILHEAITLDKAIEKEKTLNIYHQHLSPTAIANNICNTIEQLNNA